MIAISMFSEVDQFQQQSAKKEYIKVFCSFARIFQEKLLKQPLTKIVTILCRRLKEGDVAYHQAITDSLDCLILNCFKKADEVTGLQSLEQVLNLLYANFQNSSKFA